MTESNEPRPPAGMQFNAPPGWPPPPPGWVPSADFQPDPSWPAAPADWRWWKPAGGSGAGLIKPPPDATAPLSPPATPEPASAPDAHPGPDFVPGPPPGAPPAFTPGPPADATAAFGSGPPYASPDYSTGPHYPQGPPPGSGPPGSGRPPGSGGHSSWVGRHKLLTAALVVIALLALAGVGTAGAVILSNRADDRQNTADDTPPRPRASSSLTPPSPQPSPSESDDGNSAEHAAACNKAKAPNDKAVDLVKGYTTKSASNAAIIAAIPPIQNDLNAAAAGAGGVLEKDLKEYAAALGAFRTTLMQGRDANTAAAKVLIYSIVLKAECGF